MKKIASLVLILAATLSTHAQPKDTAKYDTVFVFSIKEIQFLENVLMNSKVIYNNQQLSGNELRALLDWVEQKVRIYKKEQPKK